MQKVSKLKSRGKALRVARPA